MANKKGKVPAGLAKYQATKKASKGSAAPTAMPMKGKMPMKKGKDY